MVYKVILYLSRSRRFRKVANFFGWIIQLPTAQDLMLPTAQDLIRKYAIGKTFADIGCMWGVHGAYSFFAEFSGATRIVGVDVFPPTEEFTIEHRRLNSRVDFFLGDIHKTDTTKRLGTFNVVFCKGVLYHTPDPFYLLVRLHSICDEILILGTHLIPEIPGLRNSAVFYPMLPESYRKLFVTPDPGQYNPETGYANWFWGLTPSCVEALLDCAGFALLEKLVEPFHGYFICRVAASKFSPVSGA